MPQMSPMLWGFYCLIFIFVIFVLIITYWENKSMILCDVSSYKKFSLYWCW